jgi:hypothetical protein
MSNNYTINNPILRGMYPDPSWMWDEKRDEAALVCSTFTVVPGLPLFTSQDLSKWVHVGNAVDEKMAEKLLIQYTEDSGGLYAPTLRRISDKYVIVCTVARLNADSAREDGVSEEDLQKFEAADGNFLIEADSLEGPWRGPVWISGADGIDPDIFEDTDGTVYWTQTRPAKKPAWDGQTEVWTQKLNLETGELLDVPFVLWRGYGRDAVWAEAPHLYRVGEFVYLFTAEGGTSFEHSEMAMRVEAADGFGTVLDEVRGECTKDALGYDVSTVLFKANKKNPIITHRHLGLKEPIQCVGHSDLLLHPQLGWWLTCLGVRETHVENSDIDICSFLGRETFVAPVSWEKNPAQWTLDAASDDALQKDAEDPGWPVVAAGIGKLPKAISVTSDDEKTYYKYGNETSQDDLVLYFGETSSEFVRVINDDKSWRYIRLPSDETVIMTSEKAVKIFQDSKNSLVLKSAEGALETLVRGECDGEKIGIATGEKLSLFFDKGVVRVLSVPEAEIGPSALSLASGAVARKLAQRSREVLSVDATFLATEKTGGFVGCFVGVRG